ncbi:MAG: hypothetical protein WBA48_01440 [Xanthobacteraceae bacterium]
MQKMLLDLAKSLQGAAYKPGLAKFKAARTAPQEVRCTNLG